MTFAAVVRKVQCECQRQRTGGQRQTKGRLSRAPTPSNLARGLCRPAAI